ncbi:MAG TPA: sigma-70 family RNA polymerase sigma factor [Kofleriaceae bacterium]|nr:sigma-70 family RNA polymerase sigma factor [Kofleriaceae bacterium]
MATAEQRSTGGVGRARGEGGEARPFLDWVGALVHATAGRLAAAARAEGLTGEDAVDAVQEAFARFCALPEARALAGRDDEARAFLHVMVVNTARNMRRRHHLAREHVTFDDAGEPRADLPSVDELLARAEAKAGVVTCIRRLADTQRRVVELRVLEELSSQEVADRLALSPGHVAVILHRAKQGLLACLERAGP